MNAAQMPGPGDEITWPACTGHPGDPRTEADDLLTENEVLEAAEDESDRDAYALAWWLNNHAIVEHTGPIDLGSVRERIDLGEPCTPSELLALAFNDGDKAGYCLHLLREQYRAHPQTREWVKGRAAEILAAQAEQDDDEGTHYDRQAEMLEAA